MLCFGLDYVSASHHVLSNKDNCLSKSRLSNSLIPHYEYGLQVLLMRARNSIVLTGLAWLSCSPWQIFSLVLHRTSIFKFHLEMNVTNPSSIVTSGSIPVADLIMLAIYCFKKADHLGPYECLNMSIRFAPCIAVLNVYHPEYEETGSK